jgi:hypothetical protein
LEISQQPHLKLKGTDGTMKAARELTISSTRALAITFLEMMEDLPCTAGWRTRPFLKAQLRQRQQTGGAIVLLRSVGQQALPPARSLLLHLRRQLGDPTSGISKASFP